MAKQQGLKGIMIIAQVSSLTAVPLLYTLLTPVALASVHNAHCTARASTNSAWWYSVPACCAMQCKQAQLRSKSVGSITPHASVAYVMQANPTFDIVLTEDADESVRTDKNDGYTQFLDRLYLQTKGFYGQVTHCTTR
jgi:hypothetical protein